MSETLTVGRVVFAPQPSTATVELENLRYRLAAAEKQREEAVRAMQAVQPGVLSDVEAARLQRLRDYAHTLQNRLDEHPRYNMDHTKARLSAVCWAITKISGQPFSTVAAPSTRAKEK